MTEILLTIIVLALIGLIIWREALHARQIKDVLLLKKSDRPEDYAHYRSLDEPVKEDSVTETEIDIEDTTPADWANLAKGK